MRKGKIFCKTEQSEKKLKIFIYDDIVDKKIDWSTWSVVESETGAKHIADLIAGAGNISEIEVRINSYGGYAFEGTAIYTNLKEAKAKVTVYVDGVACSAASLVAMAGDTIKMGQCSMMMIHNPWTTVSGNAKELRQEADVLDKIAKQQRLAYLTKANDKLDESRLIELLEAETWLTAEECVYFGLCDEIISGAELSDEDDEDEEKDGEAEKEDEAESETDPAEEESEEEETEESEDDDEDDEDDEDEDAKAKAQVNLSVFQKLAAKNAAYKKITNFKRLKIQKRK